MSAPDDSAPEGPVRPSPGTLFRFAVLVAVSLTMFGSYYVFDALGMVSDLIKDAHRINDAQFGFLTGIYSIAGVLALLAGGFVIDRIGTKRSVVLFGALATAAGVLIALAPSFPLLLAGRFLLGLGSEPLSVAANTALARWFKGRELSLAFGLNLTIARLGSIAADRSPQWAHAAYAGGGLRGPLGLAAGLGLSCLLGGLAYWALERGAERRYVLAEPISTDKLSLGFVRDFGTAYWLLVGLCLTFYAAVFPFQSFAAKFFMEARGVTRDEAGALLSLIPLIGMLATPLAGLFTDKIGRRALLLLVGAILVTPAYFLMLLPGLPLHVPVLLVGVAFTLIPAVLWPAVTYLVDEKRLGTAYSLMTLLQQLLVFGVSSALGWANDFSGASAQHPAGHALGQWLLTGLSVLGLLFAALLYLRERGPRAHGLETIRA